MKPYFHYRNYSIRRLQTNSFIHEIEEELDDDYPLIIPTRFVVSVCFAIFK